ncbi:MAG: tRNA 2-thiouridine(34) synthase MnmA [Ruminococcaceae bacterium]|nr:tRNA 2-thiouridine(34) synthase MnmA [Oscillospiraceae bacterium]
MKAGLKGKVALGISGGVDSAISCNLLKASGYEVCGFFCIMSESHLGDVSKVRKAADELSISIDIADVRNDFKNSVIIPFAESYSKGITPNPCVVCNEKVKFKSLLEYSEQISADYIATGHYARVIKNNGCFIGTAKDPDKDQSYVLYRLPQRVLSRLILPLGEHLKSDVVKMAELSNLSSASDPESQDICFIDGNNHAEFINGIGYFGVRGNFVDNDGRILGKHKGIEHYTVGQRRGLGVSSDKRLYVRKISGSDVVLSEIEDLPVSELKLTDTIINPFHKFSENNNYRAKTRYSKNFYRCRPKLNDGSITVYFDNKPVAAPGQSAVIYWGDVVVAGGIIK